VVALTRRLLRSKASVSLLAVTLVGGWLAAPGAAHDSASLAHNWSKHYKVLAKKIFYTKRQSNTRFINVGEQATNAALLDGLDSTAFAASSHVHSGGDITSGTVAEARIDALLSRDAEVFGIVTGADGAGSTLDTDLLDGLSSGSFASASHVHSGDDITSGTVAEARIDALLARDAEVFGIVTNNDGSGSTLDAELLDGLSSGAFEVKGLSHEVQWFKEAADGLATTTTTERVVFTAPENVTITDVFVEPAAAVTASDTAYAAITVSRRGATGGGRGGGAARAPPAAGWGGPGGWAAFGTVSLGSLTNTSLTEGEKLTIEITKTGVGVALPILSVQIEYTAN
jgi:hypothetical protein